MNSKLQNSIFLAAFLLASCSSKPDPEVIVPAVDLTENLKQIVQQENLDFYKKDFDKWSAHFSHSNSVYWICVEDDVTLRATGWADLSQFVGEWMKENPIPDADSLLKLDTIEDFQIESSGDLAFVRYRKNHQMPDGKVKELLESRTFKLEGTEWKIMGMTSAPGYATPSSSPNIFVHKDLPNE